MKFTIELASVQENEALVIVEGEDWIVAIPFTLQDNKTVIDTERISEVQA